MESHDKSQSVVNGPHLLDRNPSHDLTRTAYVDSGQLLDQHLRRFTPQCDRGAEVSLERAL